MFSKTILRSQTFLSSNKDESFNSELINDSILEIKFFTKFKIDSVYENHLYV